MSEPDSDCGALFHTATSPGALFVVVEGRTAEDTGSFELNIQCSEVEMLSDCPYTYIGCGDRIAGSNVDHPNFVGSPSPDAFFLVSIFEPATIVASTCGRSTDFRTQLWLFDDLPVINGSLIGQSPPHLPDEECTSLIMDLVSG